MEPPPTRPVQETRPRGQCVDSACVPWAHPPDRQNPCSLEPLHPPHHHCSHRLRLWPWEATPSSCALECVAAWRGHAEDDVGPCRLIRAGPASADKPLLPESLRVCTTVGPRRETETAHLPFMGLEFRAPVPPPPAADIKV